MNFKNNLLEKMREFQSDVAKLLDLQFPNLHFYISPRNEVSVWLKDKRFGCGAAVVLEDKNKHLDMFDEDYFDFLNKQVALAVTQPDKYFYCTECGRVLNIEQFEHSVFAGYYCKECAEKPEIAKLIAQSKERGFYD